MVSKKIIQPRVVSREEWLVARRWHLAEEKRVTKERDELCAGRRRLPMVKVEEEYSFDSPQGKRGLRGLFGGRRQLIVYHFRFDPKWDRGCPGCTRFVDSLGDLALLGERNTRFVLVSRAPLKKLRAYQKQRGWDDVTWLSSYGSRFNYDYHVTLDERVAPVEYNYRSKAQHLVRGAPHPLQGEARGLSVFFRTGRDVFHTYSTYARGLENLTNATALLDVTPWGRQEDWEDSPPGWPQRRTYGKAKPVQREAPPLESIGGDLPSIRRHRAEWSEKFHLS